MSKTFDMAMLVVLAHRSSPFPRCNDGDAADECLAVRTAHHRKAAIGTIASIARADGIAGSGLGARRLRSVSERTSQQTRKRVEQHSQRTETTAPEPAVRSPDHRRWLKPKPSRAFSRNTGRVCSLGASRRRSATVERPKLRQLLMPAGLPRHRPRPTTRKEQESRPALDECRWNGHRRVRQIWARPVRLLVLPPSGSGHTAASRPVRRV